MQIIISLLSSCLIVCGVVGVGYGERVSELSGLDLLEHDSRVEVRLFATEPMVIDPVAMCFTAEGWCYVVEMRDYPLGVGDGGEPGGCVRRLRDLDGDGRADESIVFASGLSWPTSITPWGRGVLVAAPPDIIYLEDTDGDGMADERKVVASGFPRGVTDSNFNGLRWAPDGRLHGVNGGNGGRITSTLLPEAAPVTLGRLDCVFDADSGRVTPTVETGGGFGLAFDEWGRSFTAHNRDYLQQRVIPQRYLDGVPVSRWLGPFTVFIAREAHTTRIFPLGDVMTRVNHPEQAGYFSSGSGTFYVGVSPFGPGFEQAILTCDQAANLIHLDVLRDRGAVAVAESVTVGQREFLASRDPAFRPTALEHGPDGAIWMADMQREVIEHPDYIPAAVKDERRLRAGDDRGRIYRLLPAGGRLSGGGGLAGVAPGVWVEALASIFPWRRETAHRLLVESGLVAEVVPALVRLAVDEAAPVGRVRALWVLQSWGCLDEAQVLAALRARTPGVRLNGVQLAERLSSPAVAVALVSLLDDEVPWVRLQAALSVGVGGGVSTVRPLLEMLRRDGADPWLVKAVLAGLGASAPMALEMALRTMSPGLSEQALQPLARLAVSLGRPLDFLNDATVTPAVVAGLAAGAETASPEQAAAWSGRLEKWVVDLPASSRPVLFDLAGALGVPVPGSLLVEVGRAEATADDPQRPESERIRAIGLLGRGGKVDALVRLLDGKVSAGLQQAVVEALPRVRTPELGAVLLGRWPEVNPAVRPALVGLFAGYRPWHDALISALENKAVVFGELNLDLEQRREFLNGGDPDLRARARVFFDDHEYSNRKKPVAELLALLPERGDRRAGARLFMERCQMCHVRGPLGNAVGPELLGLSHRSTEDLLSHIVDPNMAIHPNYVACTVVTTSGERYTGLLRDETEQAVAVLMPLGSLVSVPRERLARVTTLNRSLMPEGLDSGLLPEELKGLIEFLQSRD